MRVTKLTLKIISHARQYIALGDRDGACSLLISQIEKLRSEATALDADKYRALKGSSRARTCGLLAAYARNDAHAMEAVLRSIKRTA